MSVEIEAWLATRSAYRRPEHELRRLRTGREAERDERRAEAGRDVHRGRRRAIDTGGVGRRRVRERHLAARIRQADLPVVEVAGEDEVELARLENVEDAWVVAEEDREVRAGLRRRGEVVRVAARPASQDQPRICARDPDVQAAHLPHARLVAEQHRRAELLQIRLPRLRVAADRDVVVAEHGEDRLRQDADDAAQHRLAARMREEVTRDGDEIRPPLLDPLDGSPSRAEPRRGNAEVEVREVRDPEPVELLRQPRHLDLELAKPDPARLERAPAEGRARERADGLQTSRRASAGRGSTMWRLNFSSDSSRPAATPTSCARWRIGIANFRPVDASSFCCHASSERWQSGHGVTITSAPASIACSIGWMTSPSAVSSRAAMIGKP